MADVLAESEALAPLDAAYAAAWEVVDADLLALCRDRIGMLLGHAATIEAIDVARRRMLADWATSTELGERERACLALVEHYLVDVASVPDELVAPVREHLGDQGLVDLVNAVLVVEQRMRLELIWEALW